MKPTASRCRIRRSERGHELLGVALLGEHVWRARPRHRPADIEDDGRAEVGFLLELLDHPLVRSRSDLLVDEAQVITGLIVV
jgi:hypothetical protein